MSLSELRDHKSFDDDMWRIPRIHPSYRRIVAPISRLTRVVVFDLDRTLLPGASLVELGRHLVDRGVMSRRVMVRHSLQAWRFSRAGVGDGVVNRMRARALEMLCGCEYSALVDAAVDAGHAVFDGLYSGAKWLVERHLTAGDFCVVCSASPQELVEVVGARLGAHRSIGTRVEVHHGRLTGRLDGAFCHGLGKVERLRDELGYIDLREAIAYADSKSDLPLLQRCGSPVAVNPDRRLRQIARAAGWPVVRFDG